MKIKSNSNLLISKKLKEDDIIIFPDDCIYSGNQLGGLIGNFIDISKKDISINTKRKIIIFILVPYISLNGEKYIRNSYKYNNDTQKFRLVFNKYKNRSKLNNTDNILTKDEIDIINQYYPKNKNLIESSNRYFEDKHLIIFFYKIADLQSTIPLFYKGLVPNTHNKNISVSNLDSNYDYEIIPLVSECSHLTTDDINNNCPIPPYKKNKDIK